MSFDHWKAKFDKADADTIRENLALGRYSERRSAEVRSWLEANTVPPAVPDMAKAPKVKPVPEAVEEPPEEAPKAEVKAEPAPAKKTTKRAAKKVAH